MYSALGFVIDFEYRTICVTEPISFLAFANCRRLYGGVSCILTAAACTKTFVHTFIVVLVHYFHCSTCSSAVNTSCPTVDRTSKKGMCEKS